MLTHRIYDLICETELVKLANPVVCVWIHGRILFNYAGFAVLSMFSCEYTEAMSSGEVLLRQPVFSMQNTRLFPMRKKKEKEERERRRQNT